MAKVFLFISFIICMLVAQCQQTTNTGQKIEGKAKKGTQTASLNKKKPVGNTADDYVPVYDEGFLYGNNLGYYGNGWDDSLIAKLLWKANGNTLRAKITDTFITQWGLNIRLNRFVDYLKKYKMRNIVLITGEPAAYAHGDTTHYLGMNKPHSKLFRNMYTPIWNPDGSINPENYAAVYYNSLCQTYGPYVKFWEIVNEPDFTGNPSQWLKRAPLPSEMSNLYAPIYHYIRLLRIAYEVIKHYYPDAYVAPGGLGYYQFYDCLLRYTDNPDSGKVTADYPKTGGAYLDVVSYHVYPDYYLKKYMGRPNGVDQWQFFYSSDNAIAVYRTFQNLYESTSLKYGYGVSKPEKYYMISETNVPKRSTKYVFGSDSFQRNFVVKALVQLQKLNLISVNLFTTGDHDDPGPSDRVYEKDGDEYKQMGLYNNLHKARPGEEELNQEGVAWKTYGMLIGKRELVYDSVRTKALGFTGYTALPASAKVDGAAFLDPKSNKYFYILWARALGNKTEEASATYSFPSELHVQKLKQYNWDYSTTGVSSNTDPASISLTGEPSFFEEVGK